MARIVEMTASWKGRGMQQRNQWTGFKSDKSSWAQHGTQCEDYDDCRRGTGNISTASRHLKGNGGLGLAGWVSTDSRDGGDDCREALKGSSRLCDLEGKQWTQLTTARDCEPCLHIAEIVRIMMTAGAEGSAARLALLAQAHQHVSCQQRQHMHAPLATV